MGPGFAIGRFGFWEAADEVDSRGGTARETVRKQSRVMSCQPEEEDKGNKYSRGIYQDMTCLPICFQSLRIKPTCFSGCFPYSVINLRSPGPRVTLGN
jgi:hypothetical protein